MRELCPGEAFLLFPSPAHEMKKEELYVVPHSHSKFHAKGASRVAGSRSPQRYSLSPTTMVVFLSPCLDLCSFDHFGKCVHGFTYEKQANHHHRHGSLPPVSKISQIFEPSKCPKHTKNTATLVPHRGIGPPSFCPPNERLVTDQRA